MHLPTINRIDLSSIEIFPISRLTKSVNLRRLDILNMSVRVVGAPEIVVLSEMMPKIRELHASESSLLTTQLLRAETQDGQRTFQLRVHGSQTTLDNFLQLEFFRRDMESSMFIAGCQVP